MSDIETVRGGIPCARPDWHAEPCELCGPALAALGRIEEQMKALQKVRHIEDEVLTDRDALADALETLADQSIEGSEHWACLTCGKTFATGHLNGCPVDAAYNLLANRAPKEAS